MVLQKQVTSVLNKHKKRDNWFLTEYSVNPYEGCSCNCQYCYIRGSKYGENLEEKLTVKSNALEVLEKQLVSRSKKKQYGFVAVGSATDAYIPHEEEWKLTERFLKLLLKYRFPVFISTKRALILRDVDLLKQIDEQAILPDDLNDTVKRGVILSVSVSSMSEEIATTLEPGAIPPIQRFELISKLKDHGFLVGVNAIPVLPFISDTESGLEEIISTASQYKADYILVGGLTLFGNQTADSKTLYFKFLERKFPHLVNETSKLYDSNYYPPFYYQDKIRERTLKLCNKYGIRNSIITRFS